MKWGLFQWQMVTKGPHFPCVAIGKIVRCISRQQPGAEGLIPLCSPHIYDSQKGMLDQAVLEHFGVNHHSLNYLHQPALRCLSCSCQSVWITSTLPTGLISTGRWEIADCTSLRCWEHPVHRKECWVIILQTADLFGTRDWFCGRQFFHRSGGGGRGCDRVCGKEQSDGLGIIQAHYIYCALYFYFYFISSTSDHQALDLQPMPHNKRSCCNEETMHCPHSLQLEKSPSSSQDPAQPKRNKRWLCPWYVLRLLISTLWSLKERYIDVEISHVQQDWRCRMF